MRKVIGILLVVLVLGTAVFILYRRYYPGLTYLNPNLPFLSSARPTKQPTSIDSTGLGLSMPDGFSIEYYTQGLSDPRDLEFDPSGTLVVSEPSKGQITALPAKKAITTGLNRPHGIAFRAPSSQMEQEFDLATRMYVAETHQISEFIYYGSNSPAAPAPRPQLASLPSGGGHWTRSLLIKDNYLYVSVGSSCNVCSESDTRRAAIHRVNLDGSNFHEYASGLRNSVFMATHPVTGLIWATDMGRDNLGDDTPPDEINIIKSGFYGWPECYGQKIVDPFGNDPATCQNSVSSHIDLQAHSAPLGLAFIPTSWPKDYQGDLLVALHGSWNRSVPTGYKIIRVDLDAQGTKVGESDFISGWLPTGSRSTSSVSGRPVDLIFDPQGNLYVSDDESGSVYKVTPPKSTQ